MAVYEFPAVPGAPMPAPAEVMREFARFGLPQTGIRVEPHRDMLRLSGTVEDPETHERLLLAIGNMPGVGRVDDRLTHLREAPLLGTLGAFADLPAGAASTEMAEAMVHEAAPGRSHADMLGPAGSAFHTVRPGESLDDIARLHHGDATAALRILHANRPMLTRADALQPGMVVRVPHLGRG
jgi:hypothetical protein